ncbi:pentatricopeptide repeat-containing protein At5g66631-like [Rhodamnia argentea]|uniref:Pentatricopeptide repeat-containing protein At5g66631-like n=1 Tax=Rhodamnia argentea TaxID=178133 RepID=A0ABM3GV59_9MYRT|nr:pentatricopeptide repeat-containing protein At5g66631-like [Rhodamnia argentea]
MFRKHFFSTGTGSLFNALNQQTRLFSRDPFPSKVSHYLYRARVIDSIRLALRSNSQSSLTTLLNDRLVDSFVVTHALRSAPSADSALSVIDILKSNANFSHTQGTIYALADILARSSRREELDALVDAINARSFKNVRVSHMNLMQWYAAIGDLDSVLDTWDNYRGLDRHVCTESYNIVMRLYAEKGEDSRAVEMFHRMIVEGANPNSRTYTTIIEHLVNSGKLDAALEVFSVLPLMRIKRTTKQFSILAEGLVSVRRFDEVKFLLSNMEAEGMLPVRALLCSLQHMKEGGYIRENDEILSDMLPDDRIKSVEYFVDDTEDDDDEAEAEEEDNVACDVNKVNGVRLKPWLDPRALANALQSWSPNDVLELENAKFVWTTRLVCKVLRNFKSPGAAWNFFCWVACQPGFTHDVYTVQRMMTLLARRGHVQLVNQVMDKIRQEGLKLPFSTIKLVIDFCGVSKDPDAALKIFRHNRTLCGSISKFKLMVLYSSLLRTLTKCSRCPDALEVLDEMILNGICPDIQTFSGLMDHFAKQGDIKNVQKIFGMVRQSGIEPDTYMFKVLIHGYCKCDRAALALRVFEDMRNSKLLPDSSTKELLVKSLWKEGRRREAAMVEESCEEINESLPIALRGHIWTVSSANLTQVYNIYASTFTSSCDPTANGEG